MSHAVWVSQGGIFGGAVNSARPSKCNGAGSHDAFYRVEGGVAKLGISIIMSGAIWNSIFTLFHNIYILFMTMCAFMESMELLQVNPFLSNMQML